MLLTGDLNVKLTEDLLMVDNDEDEDDNDEGGVGV
jgi:hypothetical protein